MTVIIHKREESVKKIRLVLFSIYIIADRGLKTRFFKKSAIHCLCTIIDSIIQEYIIYSFS